jgi:hypothetical protein
MVILESTFRTLEPLILNSSKCMEKVSKNMQLINVSVHMHVASQISLHVAVLWARSLR